jgi:hypothetical protein
MMLFEIASVTEAPETSLNHFTLEQLTSELRHDPKAVGKLRNRFHF